MFTVLKFDCQMETVQAVEELERSSDVVRMRCFSDPAALARAIWRKPSGMRRFNRGIVMVYRETHVLLEELADSVVDGSRKQYLESIVSGAAVDPIDEFGMRKLPHRPPGDLPKNLMRRYDIASTTLTSNRPMEDRGSCSAM